MVNIGVLGAHKSGKSSFMRFLAEYIESHKDLTLVKVDLKGEGSIPQNKQETSHETRTIHPHRIVFREKKTGRNHNILSPHGTITVSRMCSEMVAIISLIRDLEEQFSFFNDVWFFPDHISICLTKVDEIEGTENNKLQIIQEKKKTIFDFFNKKKISADILVSQDASLIGYNDVFNSVYDNFIFKLKASKKPEYFSQANKSINSIKNLVNRAKGKVFATTLTNYITNELKFLNEVKEEDRIFQMFEIEWFSQRELKKTDLVKQLGFTLQESEKFYDLFYNPGGIYSKVFKKTIKSKAAYYIGRPELSLYDIFLDERNIRTAHSIKKYLLESGDYEIIPRVPFKKDEEKPKTLVIFISYSMKDEKLFQISKISEKLSKKVELEKVLYCEKDSRHNFVKYMEDHIRECDIMLLFCSENASTSRFVKDEWQAAYATNKIIIPVFMDLEYIPLMLRARVGVKFDSEKIESSIEEIYKTILKAIVN